MSDDEGSGMNANAVFRNDRLLAIWKDLTTEPAWKYNELPPFLLSQLTECDLLEASDSELARPIWFWCRRPKLMFHDCVASIIAALCICMSLFIAFVNWPRTSITEVVIILFIVLFEVAVEVQRLRFVRWRREYEVSVDRLIWTHHPEV
jgi:hypothetical protein